MGEYLEGNDLETIEPSETHSCEVLKTRIRRATETPDFNQDLFTQMKRAFFAVTEDTDNLALNKAKLLEFLREFLGVHYELDDVADYMQGQETITYEEFAIWWAAGPGKQICKDVVHLPSVSAGEFLLFVYNQMGVIKITDSLPV
jgi:hypothetical protein